MRRPAPWILWTAGVLLAACVIGGWLIASRPGPVPPPPQDVWALAVDPLDIRTTPGGPRVEGFWVLGTGNALGSLPAGIPQPFLVLARPDYKPRGTIQRQFASLMGSEPEGWQRRCNGQYVDGPGGKWWVYRAEWWKKLPPPAVDGAR